MSEQLSLFGASSSAARPGSPLAIVDPDDAARAFAVDPTRNVVLEASAGTGKTTVLVHRYLNLLRAGVDPRNILAITFTRKAAAEMRERIVRELRKGASQSTSDRARWVELRDRLADISISTIDAFCLSLLREFPLEADVDPGFTMADETEVPRLIEEALDRTLRFVGRVAAEDQDVALLMAQLGATKLREGLSHLLERRLVARPALARFLRGGPKDLTADDACRRALTRLGDILTGAHGGLDRFIADGPLRHARFRLLARDVRDLAAIAPADHARVRAALERVRDHFLTQDGGPRQASAAIQPYRVDQCASSEAWRRHREQVAALAPLVHDLLRAFARDLNVVLARGVRRVFEIALGQYRQALDTRSALDFSDVLERALALLEEMDEFAQSRFRLESRYHHVLVDEFQDTSQAQWLLVSRLVTAWGEGFGLVTHDAPLQPSIFVVGDRKQSIYRFRDAQVALLDEAGRHIAALRPDGDPRRSIARSYRALPGLLSFVNDVCGPIGTSRERRDGFRYDDRDRFPIKEVEAEADAEPGTQPTSYRGPLLGIAVGEEPEQCADLVAAEVARILAEETVRDRQTGAPRQARPGDVAVLFRSRASHREFEQALERAGIPTYVYKGLGFFDADEIKDAGALLRFLADPASDLRAAAFLRSRFVRLSDAALVALAPGLSAAVIDGEAPRGILELDEEDRRVLTLARAQITRWVELVDRMAPADLLELVLEESAYDYELRGARRAQARENLKKLRGLVRRIQNRGYATLARIADHLDALSAGDESNAVVEALDAVNLMTVHAAKGLEFPIVFVVNLAKGSGGPPPPIRVVVGFDPEVPSVSVGPFVSETDEDERARELEETKRLLYVALTRARDRLYLASVLRDGDLKPARGSLAEVLPASLVPLFGDAARAHVDHIEWKSDGGRVHRLRLPRCDLTPSSSQGGQTLTHVRRTHAPARGEDDFEPLPAAAGPLAVTASVEGLPDDRDAQRASEERIAGALVHRLFQVEADLGSDPLAIARGSDLVAGLLTPEERAALPAPAEVTARALEVYRALRRREDLREALNGARLCEVPFSMVEAATGVTVRGVIDCIVARGDGSVVVVEIKTGGRRPEHARQIDQYVAAARALFPGAAINALLVYP